MINYAEPLTQYLLHKDEIEAAIDSVLRGGQYILGKEVAAFEQELARFLGATSCIGCGSGTDALVLALRALDVGPGDEVIVPSFTATPTVAAVRMVGATPIFAEIEEQFFTLDPGSIERACSARTKAIIVVHLYGQPAALDELLALAKRYGLRVIEDCAQAIGAEWQGQRVGTLGDVGCFSFFPTKNLGAMGDGGALVCNDGALATRIRRLRQYGWDDHRVSVEPGINSRLDEIQAAILRVKLRYLSDENHQRRLLAARYDDALCNLELELPREREGGKHVYHLYVVRSRRRDSVLSQLREATINAGVHYPVPVHRMPAYRQAGATLPVTESAAEQVLSLPLYPGLRAQDQELTIEALRDCCRQ